MRYDGWGLFTAVLTVLTRWPLGTGDSARARETQTAGQHVRDSVHRPKYSTLSHINVLSIGMGFSVLRAFSMIGKSKGDIFGSPSDGSFILATTA